MRDIMLIIHFIGLAMGLGTSLGMLFLGIASSKMEPPEGKKFMLNALALGRMGQWGLVLLLVSGGALMTPFWSTLGTSPLLVAKLALYLVLAALIGIISAKARKAKAGDDNALKNIPAMGRMALLVALTIVVLAVYVFH